MPAHFIDAIDDPLLYERVENFGGGVNSYDRATQLPPNASQAATNVVVRDNLEACTRPGADSLGAVAAGANPCQGLFYFDTPSYEQLVTAVNTAFKYWNGSAWTTMTGYTLPSASVQFAAAQAISNLMVSDGTNYWQSWSGTAWTEEKTGVSGDDAIDPPKGATILCWHTARMFASGFSGSTGKEDDAIWVSTLLGAGKGKWNSVTRNFRVGKGEGDPIKGLASLPGFALAVLKERSVAVVYTDPTEDPADWSTDQEVENVAGGAGCVGRFAWTVYGQKVLFMSHDGVRALQRGGESRWEVTDSISLPLQTYIDRINWSYAHLIRAKRYRELVLFAVPLDSATSNDTVLVWNGHINAWLGVWTGWTPTALEVSRFGGLERLCIGDSVGRVNLWKDQSGTKEDTTYTDNSISIASDLDTRAFMFGEPVNDKDGYHAELRFSAGSCALEVTAVCDGSEERTWDVDSRVSTNQLPLNLPFDLHSSTPKTFKRGLRGLPPFNELFLRLSSTEGWWFLRNLTVSAFLNKLENE